MPSQKNIHSLADISHQLEKAKAVIFTDYSGLSVADQTALRAKLAESGGSFIVAKNNLLKIALKEKINTLPSDVEDVLQGPTAAVIALEDVVTSAKALTEFAKDKELPKIKIGLMLKQTNQDGVGEDKVLSLSEIEVLSKLPSRNQLLSNLLAQLAAPAQALVRQINAPAQLLVYALDAIARR